MTDERAKRHHYIPKFIIKNWANSSGKVWVLNQENHEIFETSIENVFVKSNLYTLQGSFEGLKSDEIEKSLAQQESKVAPVIKKIIAGARQLSPPQLTDLEFLECQKFLISITRRTPEALAKILVEDNPESYLEAMKDIPAIKDNRNTPNESKGEHIETEDKFLKRNEIPIIASGLTPAYQSQVNAFAAKRGLESLVILNPRRSLLHGSYGYFQIRQLTTDRRFHTAAGFPVAPDVTLGFTYHPDRFRNGQFERCSVEDKFVRKFNTSVVSVSKFVIAKDERLLEKYRDPNRKVD